MSILKEYIMPHPPVIIPEIGNGQEINIKSTSDAMKSVALEIREIQPETIILITPHGNLFRDAVVINYDKKLKGDFNAFGEYTLEFSFENDIRMTDEIIKQSSEFGVPVLKLNSSLKLKYMLDSRLDHGALVPLYFIEKEYREFSLVHITYGLLTEEELYNFGRALKNAAEKTGKRTVVIASGDLSHKLIEYAPAGYSPRGKEFDELFTALIKENKRKEIMTMDQMFADEAGECGLRSVQILMGTLDGTDTENKILSYEGPFGVGYAVVSISLKDENENMHVFASADKAEEIIREKNEDEYVYLARKTVETYVKKKKRINIPDDLKEKELYDGKAGVFVSLKIAGELRGCIGTIEPLRENIADEIIHNAISAAFSDPRFYPVKESELGYLEYSVDILKAAEKVISRDELDTEKYGIIVTKGSKKGLLLPNLEGIDTVDEQIDIALKKAGIRRDEEYTLERFEVIRHS